MDRVESSLDPVADTAHAEDSLHVSSAAFPRVLETYPVGGSEYPKMTCLLVVGRDDVPPGVWWWYLSLIPVRHGVVDLISKPVVCACPFAHVSPFLLRHIIRVLDETDTVQKSWVPPDI